MHIPVTPNTPPVHGPGYKLDIFRCAFDTVNQWGEPVLRNIIVPTGEPAVQQEWTQGEVCSASMGNTAWISVAFMKSFQQRPVR